MVVVVVGVVGMVVVVVGVVGMVVVVVGVVGMVVVGVVGMVVVVVGVVGMVVVGVVVGSPTYLTLFEGSDAADPRALMAVTTNVKLVFAPRLEI